MHAPVCPSSDAGVARARSYAPVARVRIREERGREPPSGPSARFSFRLFMTLIPHLYPGSLKRSAAYRASANGVALDVLAHSAADHAAIE